MFLSLNTEEGPRLINPEHIQTLSPADSGGSVVMIGNQEIVVKEDYQELMKAVEESIFRHYVGQSM